MPVFASQFIKKAMVTISCNCNFIPNSVSLYLTIVTVYLTFVNYLINVTIVLALSHNYHFIQQHCFSVLLYLFFVSQLSGLFLLGGNEHLLLVLTKSHRLRGPGRYPAFGPRCGNMLQHPCDPTQDKRFEVRTNGWMDGWMNMVKILFDNTSASICWSSEIITVTFSVAFRI